MLADDEKPNHKCILPACSVRGLLGQLLACSRWLPVITAADCQRAVMTRTPHRKRRNAMAKTPRKSKGKHATKRGKAIAAKPVLRVHEEDLVDGCDVECHDTEATPDAALPAARGGVEIPRRRR